MPAGGCDFPIDPARDAREAVVIWDPQTDPSLVVLVSTNETCDVPRCKSGHQPPSNCVIVGAGRDAITVAIPSDLSLDRSLCALVPMDGHLPDRLEALSRLWSGLRGGRVPPDRRVTPQQRQRLRRMLQAGDGHIAGASYREIAASLFGSARVATAPWKTSSLRDTVIALVGDARRMIEGDYRKLLHRRRRHVSPL